MCPLSLLPLMTEFSVFMPLQGKIQRLYWCCSSYALLKLIVDNGLEDLWRRENPNSPEFTRYDRSFGNNKLPKVLMRSDGLLIPKNNQLN